MAKTPPKKTTAKKTTAKKTTAKKTTAKKTTSKGVTHKTAGKDRRTAEEIEKDQRVARNLALMQQLEADILAARQRRR